MCKLLIIAGLNPNKSENTWKFAKLMAEKMTKSKDKTFGVNDDGLGYAAVDAQGNLFGEKWLWNEEAFEVHKQYTKPFKVDKKKIELLKKEFGDFTTMIEEEKDEVSIEKYGTFGEVKKKGVVALTLHARAASNEVSYANIHPFVDMKHSVSVIHNGYVSNHTKLDEIRSTCDSERILNQYIEHEINKVPADAQNLIDSLKGSFACGIFAKDNTGKRILDIFRTRRPLGMVYVDELGTMVYATETDDIKSVCWTLGWHISTKADLIYEDSFFRIDPVTGKLIKRIDYKDTTLLERQVSREGRTQDEYNRAWEERAKQDRERNQTQQTNNAASVKPVTESANVIVSNALTLVQGGRVYTERQRQEIEELKKAGFDNQDIDDYFERYVDDLDAVEEADRDYREEEIKHLMTEQQWDRQTAESFVDSQIKSANAATEVKQAKAIIEQITKDDYNETEAANDGWSRNKQSGLWNHRKNIKN